jgi:hypothetical protein
MLCPRWDALSAVPSGRDLGDEVDEGAAEPSEKDRKRLKNFLKKQKKKQRLKGEGNATEETSEDVTTVSTEAPSCFGEQRGVPAGDFSFRVISWNEEDDKASFGASHSVISRSEEDRLADWESLQQRSGMSAFDSAGLCGSFGKSEAELIAEWEALQHRLAEDGSAEQSAEHVGADPSTQPDTAENTGALGDAAWDAGKSEAELIAEWEALQRRLEPGVELQVAADPGAAWHKSAGWDEASDEASEGAWDGNEASEGAWDGNGWNDTSGEAEEAARIAEWEALQRRIAQP